MGKRRTNNLSIEGALGSLREFVVEKPLYLLLGAVILFLWGFERWVFPVSGWVPVIAAVWAANQYASHQRQIVIEDLNRKWKRAVLDASPTTPIEHCAWLNKLLIEIWPNHFNPMLSMRFSSMVEKRLKHKRPKLLEKIELQDFSLGSSPPSLALEGARWSTVDSQKMMHLGFEWDTKDMSILLAAKLAKPLYGTARIVINHLFIKGELQLFPVLDGRAILYSFLAVPEVRIGVAFGGGVQSLPATELPGVSSWLVKLLSETLVKTMVEPRRRCFSLPAVHMRKKAVAGIILVTVVEASKISRGSLKGSPSNSRRQQSHKANGTPEEPPLPVIQSFVEVELEQLTRRTGTKRGTSPRWDSTFNMVLHDSAGNLKFHLYECNPGNVKYDYLASCEVKFRYCEDDSTIFWAIGTDSSAIAKQIKICGEEVEMTVPFEGSICGEITVKLVLKEWQFSDGSQTSPHSSQQGMYGSTNFSSMTGRKINVTVAEARNLVRKDKNGKCNPYVKLHYGKTMRKTKAITDNETPSWNQKFEFEELGGGEYLTLKCFSEETFGDEQIGSARVNLEGLVDGSVKEEWIPLEKVTSGDVKLVIESVRIDNYEGSKGSGNASGNGWIELVLIEGKDLIAADLRGTSDPYVKVQYGNIKKRTKVIYKTLNPQWHQTLEFVDNGSALKLYVRDHNAILASTSIGECEIEYQMLPLNQTYDKWIPLQGVRNGEIHVLITRKVPELDRRNSVDSDSSSVKAQKITSEMKQLLMKLQSLAGEGDYEGLAEIASELESLEDIQEEYLVQLETERSLLLGKVNELGQEIFNSQASPSRQSFSSSKIHSKSSHS